MAEASDPSISGGTVTVGTNNTTTVYQGLPISPENLPPGCRFVLHMEITTDPSAAAAYTEEEHHVNSQQPQQQQQEQQQQQQQPIPQTRGQRTRGQPKQPQQYVNSQQQQQQQQQQQHHQQQQQLQQQQQQRRQRTTEPTSTTATQADPTTARSTTSTAEQTATITSATTSTTNTATTTTPVFNSEPSTTRTQPKRTNQQPSLRQQDTWDSSESSLPQTLDVQGRITTTVDTMTSKEAAVTSEASFRENPGGPLPYSLYPAMPLGSRGTRHPVQETGRNGDYISAPLPRPSSCGHTTPKAMYSINPAECPPTADSTLSEDIVKLRILPQSINNLAKLESFDTKVDTDKEASEITDIIVVTLASKPVVIVSDGANKTIKLVRDVRGGGNIQSVQLHHAPTSLSPYKDGRALVAYCNVKSFSVVNLVAMTKEHTYQTCKVYCGIRCIDHSSLAACCHQTKSVDILDMNGQLLRSITSASHRKPSFLSVSSCIAVTDWESSTLSCFTREGHCKFVVSPSGKNSSFGGVVQHGGKIYVADETGNRILCFEDTGKKVEMVLGASDGVERPRGLSVHNNTLFVGLVGGRVLSWNLPVVMDTRL